MKKSLVFFLMLVVLALNACGKMSAPVPYEGSDYPRTYPKR